MHNTKHVHIHDKTSRHNSTTLKIYYYDIYMVV